MVYILYMVLYNHLVIMSYLSNHLLLVKYGCYIVMQMIDLMWKASGQRVTVRLPWLWRGLVLRLSKTFGLTWSGLGSFFWLRQTVCCYWVGEMQTFRIITQFKKTKALTFAKLKYTKMYLLLTFGGITELRCQSINCTVFKSWNLCSNPTLNLSPSFYQG